MPDGIDASQFELPKGTAAIFAGVASPDAYERSALVERLRKQHESAEADLEWRSREFERLYAQAAATSDFAGIAQLHQIVREKGRTALELIGPSLEKMQVLLASPLVKNDPEGERLYRRTLATGFAWLDLYKNLEQKLSRLLDVESEVLRARPPEGEVDHEALSREFMARFPRIRAGLAK